MNTHPLFLAPHADFHGLAGFGKSAGALTTTPDSQGVYAWQTLEDARNYSQSIAMRFMTERSYPESVSFQILDRRASQYWLFSQSATRSSAHQSDEHRERYV